MRDYIDQAPEKRYAGTVVSFSERGHLGDQEDYLFRIFTCKKEILKYLEENPPSEEFVRASIKEIQFELSKNGNTKYVFDHCFDQGSDVLSFNPRQPDGLTLTLRFTRGQSKSQFIEFNLASASMWLDFVRLS